MRGLDVARGRPLFSGDALPREEPRAKDLAYLQRLFALPALFFALVGFAIGLNLNGESRQVILASAASVLVMLSMHWALTLPSKPQTSNLAAFAVLIGAYQPVLLILTALLDSEILYLTNDGLRSHFTGGVRVAMARTVFILAIGGGGFLLRASGVHSRGWSATFTSMNRSIFVAARWIAMCVLLAKLTIEFRQSLLPEALKYFFRLFIGFYTPVFAIAGMSIKRWDRWALGMLAACMIGGAALLMTGSREDALLAPMLFGIGYLLTRVTKTSRLFGALAVGGVIFLVCLFVGSYIRQDDRGRGGDAALERMLHLSDTFNELGAQSELIVGDTLRRMMSDSTHSVILLVPSERPYESDGLVRLPVETLRALMPGFNFSGISETDTPRHFVLNDFGFYIGWETSVELEGMADAWLRGGMLALLVMGVAIGLYLQVAENLIMKTARLSADWAVMLVFAACAIRLVVLKDFIWGFRNLLFCLAAGALFTAAFRARKPIGAKGVGLRPAWTVERPRLTAVGRSQE